MEQCTSPEALRISVSLSHEQHPPPKNRLPKVSVKILRNWLSAHSYHPYPSNTERAWLEAQTGLTPSQIANWFSNARRRQRLARSSNSMPITAAQSVPDLHATSKWDKSDPLTRWRNSPPEQEHVPLHTLANALSESLSSVATNHNANFFAEPRFQPPHATSEASFDSWGSLHSSISSSSYASSGAFSTGSAGDSTSSPWRTSLGRQRRRRLPRSLATPMNQLDSGIRSHDQSRRPYQCTFCTDTFKTKFDWVRHEGSLHLALEKWICLYSGPTYQDSSHANRCVFCDEHGPTETHLAAHRYHDCIDKPLPGRTFFRQDHLRQHTRLVHSSDRLYPSMQEWRLKATRINCRCGFCERRFQDWSERNEHLADHFRCGAKMKDWTGCRGLDPAVALHVQNAIPPYLIANESNNFEPFSASNKYQNNLVANTDPELPGRQQPRQPTRFEDLTAQLAEYVRDAIADGLTVTDETVRRKARLFMFGDDDAWNQTPADNKEWLRLFKLGLNLNPSKEVVSSASRTMTESATSHSGLQHAHPTASARSPSVLEMTDLVLLDDFFAVPEAPQSDGISGSLTCNTAAIPGIAGGMPLAWQTPECLAEFEEMRLTRNKGRGQDSGSGQACVSSIHEASNTASMAEGGTGIGLGGEMTDELQWGDPSGLDMDFFLQGTVSP